MTIALTESNLQDMLNLMEDHGVKGPIEVRVPYEIRLLSGELGRYEGLRIISSDAPCQIGRPKKVYQRPPSIPNPELQSAAEAKRQRKLERNRRNLC